MENERDSWNRRYREGSHGSLKPDPLLVRAFGEYFEPHFPRGGNALDVAGGSGRHAIWLAERGWHVTLVDISDVGVERARKNAAHLGDKVEFQVADLKNFKAGRRRYDVIVVFYYLERKLFPQLAKALRPGGRLIYKTYTREQRKFKGGPSHPLHLLKENELLKAFSDLHLLHYSETIRARAVAEFVGRKA